MKRQWFSLSAGFPKVGDVVREYNAMHEENFLGSWLREDLVGKEKTRKVDEKIRGGVSKKEKKRRRREKRWRERRERDGECSKKVCRLCVSAEAFDIFCQGEEFWCFLSDLLQDPNDLSGCEPETQAVVSPVPVVTDVPVFPFFGGDQLL